MIDHGRHKFDGPFNMNLGDLTCRNIVEHVFTKVNQSSIELTMLFNHMIDQGMTMVNHNLDLIATPGYRYLPLKMPVDFQKPPPLQCRVKV